MNPIQSSIFPPPDSLREYVACFRISRSTSHEAVCVRVCPNGFPGIAFQHQDGGTAIESIDIPSRHEQHPPTLFLYGQVTTLSEMHFTPPFIALQAVLKPQALWEMFHLDASLLTDKSLSAAAFGAETLNAQLITASSDEERIAVCSTFLEGKLANVRASVKVAQAVVHVDQQIDTITAKELQSHTGLSQRQFERQFKRVVGVTPYYYIRLRRINAALRLMDSGKYEHLIDIAHALNFHDQSHFIHDMKEFSGLTPKSILQRVDDFYHDQVGSSYLLF